MTHTKINKQLPHFGAANNISNISNKTQNTLFCITEEIDDKTIKKIERICNKISKAHTEDLKTLTLVRTQSGQKRGIVENLFNEFAQKIKDETNISITRVKCDNVFRIHKT